MELIIRRMFEDHRYNAIAQHQIRDILVCWRRWENQFLEKISAGDRTSLFHAGIISDFQHSVVGQSRGVYIFGDFNSHFCETDSTAPGFLETHDKPILDIKSRVLRSQVRVWPGVVPDPCANFCGT